jgi:ketosteroid isomerase-like protein
MSQESVDIVRRSIDAYNRGDVDGLLSGWAPDAVLDWSNSRGFDARVFRGHDEIRAFIERFIGSFESARIELIGDLVEVDEGLVVAENVTYLRGRGGIEVEARSAWLIVVREGAQISLTLYQTKQGALEAAGLQG